MPPRSPLPLRHGLSAAWVRTPDRDRSEAWPTMGAWLRHRLDERVDVTALLADERFVYDDLRPVRDGDPYLPHTFVWFHRDLRDEPEVPGALPVIHRDERIVVVDKPPFLSTIPRGQHVTQSVVVRLRAELGPARAVAAAPARPGDVRGADARDRARGGGRRTSRCSSAATVRKTYRALAPWRADLTLPVTVRNHIRKERGAWRAEVVPGRPGQRRDAGRARVARTATWRSTG